MSGLNDALNILKELRKEYWEDGTGLHTDYYITMDDIDRLDKAIEILEKQANGVTTVEKQCNLPVVSDTVLCDCCEEVAEYHFCEKCLDVHNDRISTGR